jgi:hypothetical protein
MTRIQTLFMLLTFLLAATGAAETQNKAVQMPTGKLVVLDGQISDEEWRGAYKQQLSGGGEISFQKDGSSLYVGVRGLKEGWSHVCVTAGERVYVLHASAALAEAIYEKDPAGVWRPIQGFDPATFALRQTDQSEETVKARKAFFDSHGWLANNNRMGSRTVIEFKLGPKFLKSEEVRLAVVYASDAKSPQYWPESLADDSIKEDLIFGKTPQDMKFNQASWGRLRF